MMNDYRKYKFEKWLERAVDILFDFVFYAPRKLYKCNKKFRDWIINGQNKSYDKRERKRILSKIFIDIDRYGQCKILLFTDYDTDIPCDRHGLDYRILAESEDWAKKNKLEVERLSFYEYIEKYYPEESERFKWYGWHGKEEERVVVVRRISR